MYNIACIDIGTVSARLALAQFDDENLCTFEKVSSVICNLGEGLSTIVPEFWDPSFEDSCEQDEGKGQQDESVELQNEWNLGVLGELVEGYQNEEHQNLLSGRAMQRTIAAVKNFVQQARDWAQNQPQSQTQNQPQPQPELRFVCTLTSAARDAQNADELLDALRELGLDPQILSGELEAYLTFSAVSRDFIDKPLLVCDCGGGSTELIYGTQHADHTITIHKLCSMQLGARRLTDTFLLGQDSLSVDEIQEAYDYCCDVVYKCASWLYDDTLPERVPPSYLGVAPKPDNLHFVAVGGTATSLVAMENKLVPYDASRVHLAKLDNFHVRAWLEELGDKTEEQREKIVGLQPQRAPVIFGGTMILDAILSIAEINVMQVSEHDLLQGVACAVHQACRENQSFVEWLEQKAQLL